MSGRSLLRGERLFVNDTTSQKVQARTNLVYHGRRTFRSDPPCWPLDPFRRVRFVAGEDLAFAIRSSLEAHKANGSDVTNSN